VVIKVGFVVLFCGEGRMAESCGWVFVDNIPLIYEKRRVARQLQVETWLQLSQLVKDLRIEDFNSQNRRVELTKGYIS
jgi:hypothetical protein